MSQPANQTPQRRRLIDDLAKRFRNNVTQGNYTTEAQLRKYAGHEMQIGRRGKAT